MSFEQALQALRGQRVAREWVVTARARRSATVEHGERELRRLDDHARVAGVVHRDLTTGRGSGRFVVEGEARTLAIDRALVQAGVAVGPSWSMAAPAAPARVALDDAALGEDLEAAAEAITTLVFDAVRARRVLALAGGAIEVTDVRAIVTRDARRVASLARPGRALDRDRDRRARAAAPGRSRDRDPRARAPARRPRADRDHRRGRRAPRHRRCRAAAGGARYPIVLRLAALAPLEGHGLWAALVAQADAATVRRGLSRYRPGQPIVAGADTVGEPLTIASDGTLPYGLDSAPLGDDGEPVRRFTVIARGKAVELASDLREAALAETQPNGGFRNLVVEPGASPAAALITSDEGPVLDVASFTWIDVDPATGRFAAGIELAHLREGDRAVPVTGAVVRGDSIAALASARRAAEVTTRGGYRGPVALRLAPLPVT